MFSPHPCGLRLARRPLLAAGLLVAILAASAPAAAQTETELVDKVAPESATTAGEAGVRLQKPKEMHFFQPKLTGHFRTYDLQRDDNSQESQHTWAAGGWLGVETQRWWNLVSGGATAYGSFPLQTQGAGDPTLLVAPDGGSLAVIGEAYVDISRDNFSARLYRQRLSAPYLNDQDTRMIPNTFEAYTLGYNAKYADVGGGHVTRIKTRNSDAFVPMAEVAGATGASTGVTVIGARLPPLYPYQVSAILMHNWDVFSTFYSEANWDWKHVDGLDARLGAQFTSQRSVGQELIGSFSTWTSGLKASGGYRGGVLTLAGTVTGEGAAIRSPFGLKPSYNTLMLFDYDRAGERSMRIGFSDRLDWTGVEGLSFVLNYAQGVGARALPNGVDLPRRSEADFTLDYRPKEGGPSGLWLRLRFADGRDGDTRIQELRLILNYEVGAGG